MRKVISNIEVQLDELQRQSEQIRVQLDELQRQSEKREKMILTFDLLLVIENAIIDRVLRGTRNPAGTAWSWRLAREKFTLASLIYDYYGVDVVHLDQGERELFRQYFVVPAGSILRSESDDDLATELLEIAEILREFQGDWSRDSHGLSPRRSVEEWRSAVSVALSAASPSHVSSILELGADLFWRSVSNVSSSAPSGSPID